MADEISTAMLWGDVQNGIRNYMNHNNDFAALQFDPHTHRQMKMHNELKIECLMNLIEI